MGAEKMQTLHALVETIIAELARVQAIPGWKRDKDDEFRFPRMISAGNGEFIFVSRAIDNGIYSVADQLMLADPQIATKHTRGEWRDLVRRAFGPALLPIDLDDDLAANADVVLSAVRAALGGQVAAHGVREYAFGCTLFGRPVDSFSIGVVRFESRLEWLTRKFAEGAISKVSFRRIGLAWQGKRLRKRKPSNDRYQETDIIDAIGRCAFVCSVTTEGLAAEAGREKALTAARLATTAIALMWRTPSRTLEGINLAFDRTPHRQESVAFLAGRTMASESRWSVMPHATDLEPAQWRQLLSDGRELFDVTGEVIAYGLSPTGDVRRPRLMNALYQALLWFHEGCREAVTLMAIVKFSSALDALACGGKIRGIQRLITARLGMEADKPIRANGPTLRQAISEIYSDGRSRTIHGTNDKLGNDWASTRALAEQFARLCLLTCFDWAADNPAVDDPTAMSR